MIAAIKLLKAAQVLDAVSNMGEGRRKLKKEGEKRKRGRLQGLEREGRESKGKKEAQQLIFREPQREGEEAFVMTGRAGGTTRLQRRRTMLRPSSINGKLRTKAGVEKEETIQSGQHVCSSAGGGEEHLGSTG